MAGEQKGLWGWYPAGNIWVKMQVSATGQLVIDPTAIFEQPPTLGELEKGATSNWCNLHNADPDRHHNRLHTMSDALDHAGAITDAQHGVRTLVNAHAHGDLSGIGPSDHHVRYTDAEAIAAAKTDPTLLNYTQGARAYSTASQSIPNAAWTAVNFEAELWDTDSIHDNVTDNTRLTCKTAGVYVISGGCVFPASAVGIRVHGIYLNGTNFIGMSVFTTDATYGASATLTIVYKLAVNDYVEYKVFQNSGGALSVISIAGLSPVFTMQRIG